MLVAVISQPSFEAACAEIERAKPYADLFEIRLDAMGEDALARLRRFSVPVLFTFREKGNIDRFKWLDRLLALEPDYCDLETNPHWIETLAPKYPKTRFISSYHNFEKTPADLSSLLASMYHPHFSFYKIAVTAQSSLDLLRLCLFARQSAIPLSCISMGPFGLPSRVLGPIMGNRFDYASLEETPSRYSLKTLYETYRYRKLNRDTAIYALLGNPVDHSKGPEFHNKAFEGRNAVYIKICLAREELSSGLSLMRQLPFQGLSVTMPLKEAILPFLDQIDPTAAAIGAVNTVAIRKGQFVGSNTDGVGALNVLEKRSSVRGKRIAIVGAGGSARAIAFEALKRGAEVKLFNRTLCRAQAVARTLGCEAFSLNQLTSFPCDLLINTLPSTAQKISFPLSTPVMDIVYPPRGHNALYIRGEQMWLEQALLQQQIWK